MEEVGTIGRSRIPIAIRNGTLCECASISSHLHAVEGAGCRATWFLRGRSFGRNGDNVKCAVVGFWDLDRGIKRQANEGGIGEWDWEMDDAALNRKTAKLLRGEKVAGTRWESKTAKGFGSLGERIRVVRGIGCARCALLQSQPWWLDVKRRFVEKCTPIFEKHPDSLVFFPFFQRYH